MNMNAIKKKSLSFASPEMFINNELRKYLGALALLIVLISDSAQAQISSWTNGGFESGSTGWTTSVGSGAATFAIGSTSTHSGVNGFSTVVANPGTSPNFPSLTHSTFTASSTGTYALFFWAYASTNRPIMSVNITSATGTYSVDFQPSNLGWDEYRYTFKASGTTTISFTFEAASTYYLDDILVFDQNDSVIDTSMTYLWQWGQSTYAQTHTNCLTGTDNNISVPLPDGRVLWLFNDTWTYSLDFYSNYRGQSLGLPRNYLVVQNGSTLTPLTGSTFFTPTTSGNIYWPTDATVDGNNLYVLLAEVSNGGGGSQVAQAIASISLSNLTLTGVVNLPWKYARILNAGDGYIYIYGVGVARVPVGSFGNTAAWTFYNGTSWVSDSSQAVALTNLDSVSAIERLGQNNYALIYNGYLGAKFYARFAPSPIGPWGNAVQVGATTAGKSVSYFYMPYLHKETAQNGVYTIGYSDNGTGESDVVRYNKSFYNPHYIKTPNLLDLSPYTADTFSESFTNAYAAVGWRTYGGTWTISSGTYNVTAANDGYYAIAKGIVVSDLNYEADLTCTGTNSSGQVGLTFRGSNFLTGSDNYNGYNVILKPGTGVILGRSNGGGSNNTLATYPMTIVAGITYHVKVVAGGTSIQVFVTDMATPVITKTDSTYTRGGIGVRVYKAGGVWDNISVTNYTLSAEVALLSVAASSGDSNSTFSDSGALYGQGVTYASNGVGDYVVYAVNVPNPGTYAINTRFKKGYNRGVVGLSIGSSATGPFTAYGSQSINLYAASLAYVNVGPIATVTFATAGTQYFKFTVTGKDTYSTGYQMVFDTIQLTEQ